MRDCPMVASRGREGKKVSPSVPKDDAPIKKGISMHSSLEERSRMGVVMMVVSSFSFVVM